MKNHGHGRWRLPGRGRRLVCKSDHWAVINSPKICRWCGDYSGVRTGVLTGEVGRIVQVRFIVGE